MCVRVLRVSGFLRVHGNNFVIPCLVVTMERDVAGGVMKLLEES